MSALACLSIGRAHAAERTSPLPKYLPLGVEACFGRTYDAAHLAQHPQQQVTALYLFREFSDLTDAEHPPQTAAELREDDGNNGSITLLAYLRLRNRGGVFWHGFSCSRDGSGARCIVDCDGGAFKLQPSGQALTLRNEGFTVIGGCGGADEDMDDPERVEPGADDRTFRLDPAPVAQCTAMRAALKPSTVGAGTPLRVRFDRPEAVCFGQTYDAAHLAAHPRQTVRSIRVTKAEGERAEDASWPIYKLRIRAELKDGRQIEKTATCVPDDYVYRCRYRDDDPNGLHNFELKRAGSEAAMLRDAHAELGGLLGVRLGSDDRSFLLRSLPAETCTR